MARSPLYQQMLTDSHRKAVCTLAIVMGKLSLKDRADVRAAIKDPEVTSTAIVRALRPHGFIGSGQIIRRHRDDACRACKGVR